jgi:hypothetical protein
MQRGKAERCLAKCIGEAAASSFDFAAGFAEIAASGEVSMQSV